MPPIPPQHLIPPLEFGVPSPTWVFIFLMNLTLVLHFLGVGYVFTTALLQIFWSAAREGSAGNWMLRRTDGTLPVALSYTITLGVAPLLFVQVLYPSYFYTASILIGYQWFGLVAVLIAAFYLMYILQGGVVLGRRIPRPCELFGRLLIFLCLGYVLSTLTTIALLELHPELWLGVNAAHNLATTLSLRHLPVLGPRLGHNIGAALVIGSILLMIQGAWAEWHGRPARDSSGAQALRKLGGLMALVLIAVQMSLGIWLFVAESDEVHKMLLSGARPASILWMIALAAAMGLLIVAALGLTQPRTGKLPFAAAGALALVLGGMFSARDAVRQVHLAPYFQMRQWDAMMHLQISSLVFFLALFVLALVLIALMLNWMRQAGAEVKK